MSTAEQWAGLLAEERQGYFTLVFERLGMEAECRSLNAGEVEECRRMGGQRGLRYALYLACPALREAGEALQREGRLAMAFQITERLPYADLMAAGNAILERSGGGQAKVSLKTKDGVQRLTAERREEQSLLRRGDDEAAVFSAEEREETDGEADFFSGKGFSSGNSGKEEQALALARFFADRLTAAAGNL